jgi:hypothetical protein
MKVLKVIDRRLWLYWRKTRKGSEEFRVYSFYQSPITGRLEFMRAIRPGEILIKVSEKIFLLHDGRCAIDTTDRGFYEMFVEIQ